MNSKLRIPLCWKDVDFHYLSQSGDPENPALTEAVTLEMSWQDHADNAILPAGIDASELKALGLELLREVAEREATETVES